MRGAIAPYRRAGSLWSDQRLSAHERWGIIKHERVIFDGRGPDSSDAFASALTDGIFGDKDNGDRELLAVALHDAWTRAKFPCVDFDAWFWTRYFDASGYQENGLGTERPAARPVLYRAAIITDNNPTHPDDVEEGIDDSVIELYDGLAWTEDLQCALS